MLNSFNVPLKAPITNQNQSQPSVLDNQSSESDHIETSSEGSQNMNLPKSNSFTRRPLANVQNIHRPSSGATSSGLILSCQSQSQLQISRGAESGSSVNQSQPTASSFTQPNFQSLNNLLRVSSNQDSAFEVLPSENSAQFKSALNAPVRIQRLINDKMAELIYLYDVPGIIRKARNGSGIIQTLDQTGFIHGPQRKIVVQALQLYIEKSVKHHSQNSTHMRESIAVCLLSAWPTLAMVCCSKDDRPWHHWYNPKENTGFIAHVTATFQRNLKKEGKQVRPRKEPTASPIKKPRLLKALSVNDIHSDIEDPETYTAKVNEANRLTANSITRPQILKLMEETYERRRNKILHKEVSPAVCLAEFRHFLSFGGEVILQEFSLLHPEKVMNFQHNFIASFVPKLLALARKDNTKYAECFQFDSDVLNAVVILTKFLGTPRRSYLHEEKMPQHLRLKDFVNLIPTGSDPEEAALNRQQDGYPIQPHLIGYGDQRRIDKFFLYISEGKILDLRNLNAIKAVDMLIKSYFAFNLHYPLAWKNALRFIQVHIFDIPAENQRESIFSEKLLILKNTC